MKRFFKQTLKVAALSMLGLLVPVAGQAFFIDSDTALGSTFQVDFLLEDLQADGNGNVNNFGQYDGQVGQDIQATVVFTLTSFGPTEIGFRMNVENTSLLLGNDIGLQAFAFGTNPDATSITLTQTDLFGDVNKFISASLTIDDNLNNAVAFLDVQTSTGSGYPNTLQEQQFDVFFLTVGFNSTEGGVTFSPFGTKWQGEPDSFQFGNGNGDDDPGRIPEPATIVLLGAGLLGLVGIRRRLRGPSHGA